MTAPCLVLCLVLALLVAGAATESGLPARRMSQEAMLRARRRAQHNLEPPNYPYPALNKDKLVYLVLFGMPEHLHIKRTPWLIKSVKLLAENVLPWTPIQVVVWYELPFPQNVTDLMHDYMDGNIEFIKLRPEEWIEGDPEFMKPELYGGRDKLRWTIGLGDVFNIEYRRMGHWLTVYPFQWALQHGYVYGLKWDDDSYIHSPVRYNMVEVLRSKNAEFAFRSMIWDGWGYLAGLAELTRYFITSTGIQPTYLYEYCKPNSIDGMFWNEDQHNKCCGEQNGWNGRVYFGNVMMFRTDYFTRPEVLEYLRLAVESGGIYRNRWGEQAVLNMLPMMFTPKDQVHEFDWHYSHIG